MMKRFLRKLALTAFMAGAVVHVAAGADLLVGGKIASATSSHLHYPDDIVIWVGTSPLGGGDDPLAKYAEAVSFEAEYEIVDARNVNGAVLARGYSTNGIVRVKSACFARFRGFPGGACVYMAETTSFNPLTADYVVDVSLGGLQYDRIDSGYDGVLHGGKFWYVPDIAGVVAESRPNGSYVNSGYVTCCLKITGLNGEPNWQCRIGENNFATLEAALEAAQDGDTIHLKRDLNLSSHMSINKNVTLTSEEGGTVSIRHVCNWPVTVKADVVLTNIIVNGLSSEVKDSVFFVNKSGRLTLGAGTVVSGCVNTREVIGVSVGAINCSLGDAGAICSRGTVVLDGARIVRCSTAGHGGAIHANGGSVVVRNAEIAECSSALGGGAIYVGKDPQGNAATLTLAGNFRATDNVSNGAVDNIQLADSALIVVEDGFTGEVGVGYSGNPATVDGVVFGSVSNGVPADAAERFRYDSAPETFSAVIDGEGRLVWQEYAWNKPEELVMSQVGLGDISFGGAEAKLVDGEVVLIYADPAAAGTFTITSNTYARVLCVGGGAAGGTVGLGVAKGAGGGGGAGGFYEMETVLKPGTYHVAVGAGAARVDSYVQSWVGNNGGASWIAREPEDGDPEIAGYVISAKGGGGGGAPNPNGLAVEGGSGGGGSWWGNRALAAGTAADGYGWKGAKPAEESVGGGGGGAAATAAAGTGKPTGAGGAGRVSDITGEAVAYAAGGAGGRRLDAAYEPQDGATPGSGGDGAGVPGKGGAGTDGVVVVRLGKEFSPVKVPYPSYSVGVPFAPGETVSPFGDGLADATNRVFIAEITGELEVACAAPAVGMGRHSFTVTLKDGYVWDDGSAEGSLAPKTFFWRVREPGVQGQATAEVTKTVSWSDGSSNAVISIEAHTSPEIISTPPKVLVVGTLCNAHNLTFDVVRTCLNTAAEVADVEYYFYKKVTSTNEASVTPIRQGELACGEQLAYDAGFASTLQPNTHESLYGFYDRIARLIDEGKTFDYLILAFDRSHTADSFPGTHPREADVAEFLRPLYAAGRVVWLVDNESPGVLDCEPMVWATPWCPSQLKCMKLGYKFFWTTYYAYDIGQSCNSGQISSYYDEPALAPWREKAWNIHKALFGMFDPEAYASLRKQDFLANLIDGIGTFSYERHEATSGRVNPNQVVYDDAGNVGELVRRIVQPIAYTVTLEDSVHIDEDLALDDVGGLWTTNAEAVGWMPLVAGENVFPTEKGVSINIDGVNCDVWIKLDLHVHDKGQFRTSVNAEYNPRTGHWEKDPNDGPVLVQTKTDGSEIVAAEDMAATEVGWTFLGFELTGTVESNTNGLNTGDIVVNGYSTNWVAVGVNSSPQVVFRAAPGYILDRLEVDGEAVPFDIMTCEKTFDYVRADHDVKVWYRPYFVMDPPPPETGPVTNVYDGAGYAPTVANVCFSEDIPYPWYPVYSFESNGVYSAGCGQTNVVYDADGNVTSTNLYVRIAVLQPGYEEPVVLDNWTGVNEVTILPREVTIEFDGFSQTNDVRKTGDFAWTHVGGELMEGDEIVVPSSVCTNYPEKGTYTVGSITTETAMVVDAEGNESGNYVVRVVPGNYYWPDHNPFVEAKGVTVVYDGQDYGITVKAFPPQNPPTAEEMHAEYGSTGYFAYISEPELIGAIIRYSVDGGETYPLTEPPTYADVGTNTVHCRVTYEYRFRHGRSANKVTNSLTQVYPGYAFADVIILPRPVYVTADSAEKFYDGEALADGGYTVAPPTSVTGFVEGEGATFRMTGDSTITNPGSTANRIDPSGVQLYPNTNRDNYEFHYFDGTLTVKDRILSVPTGVDKVYDGDPAGIGVTVAKSTAPDTPLASGEYTIKYSLYPDDPESWTNDLSFLSVGVSNKVYYVVEMQDFDPVTNFEYVTIWPREIVVTADDKTKVAGEDDPVLTWTVTGGTNAVGETVGILQDEADLVLAAVSNDVRHVIFREGAGTEAGEAPTPPDGSGHPIVIGGSDYLGNYHVTYVPGTLIIPPIFTSNIHGLLKIESPFANTIIPAPWKGYTRDGSPTNDIPVDRLVKPRNLTDGDMILQYSNGGVYKAWTLEKESGGEGVWTPMNTVAQTPVVGGATNVVTSLYVAPTGDETQKRGYGMWLVRQRPVDEDNQPIPFYLYGQWMTGVESVSIGGVDEDDVAIKYAGAQYDVVHDTMLADPDCTRASVINRHTWAGFDSADTIILNTDLKQSLYCFRREKPKRSGGGFYDGWWIWGADGYTTNNISTPPGVGFWYERRAAGDMALTWEGPARYKGEGRDLDVWIVDHADAGDGRTHLAFKFVGEYAPAAITADYIRELFDSGSIRYLHATGETQTEGKAEMDRLSEDLKANARVVPALRNGTGVNTEEELAKGWIWVTVDVPDGTAEKSSRDGTGDTNGAGDLWRIVVGRGVW